MGYPPAVNGAGAFAAIVGVPEPATLALIGLGSVIALGRRRSRNTRRALMTNACSGTFSELENADDNTLNIAKRLFTGTDDNN